MCLSSVCGAATDDRVSGTVISPFEAALSVNGSLHDVTPRTQVLALARLDKALWPSGETLALFFFLLLPGFMVFRLLYSYQSLIHIKKLLHALIS
jgi:hypothetical protein